MKTTESREMTDDEIAEVVEWASAQGGKMAYKIVGIYHQYADFTYGSWDPLMKGDISMNWSQSRRLDTASVTYSKEIVKVFNGWTGWTNCEQVGIALYDCEAGVVLRSCRREVE